MSDTGSNDDLDRLPTDEELGRLQWTTVDYYLKETNPANGLVRDKTDPTAPASIAAVGHGAGDHPGRRRAGRRPREFGASDARSSELGFFRDSPQGPEPDATGYKGFYYHFLDMETGRRVWQCELSTIDSAFLFAGHADVRRVLRPRHGSRGRDPPTWRTSCTAGPTGTGPATAGRP